MEKNDKSTEVKKRGTPPREIFYSEAAKYAIRAIRKVVYLMSYGDNDSVRLGAAKTILAKAIPDLHETELKGDGQGIIQLFVNVGSGFVPTSIRFPTSSVGNTSERQSPLQSNSLAQES